MRSARMPEPDSRLPAEPLPLLAARLVERAADSPLVFVARGEARAARLHRAMRSLAPRDLPVAHLPAWDCLPYDRVSPSATVMGARMATTAGPAPRLLVMSVEAAMQRLPRPAPGDALRIAVGEDAGEEALARRLVAHGYRLDEVVDEPGEVALRGGVLDLFPATAAQGWRLRFEEGRIAAIEGYDPATQRSLGDPVEALEIGPASELILPEDHPFAAERPRGLVHHLPAFREELLAPLELMPGAAVVLDEGTEDAVAARAADIAEAFRLRIAQPAATPGLPPLPPPAALFLDEAAWQAALAGREVHSASGTAADATLPRFAGGRDPDAAFLRHAAKLLEGGARLAIAGGIGRGARRLAARLAGGKGAPVADGWPALLALPRGAVALLREAPDAEGFATPEAVLVPLVAIRPGAVPPPGAPAVEALAPASLQPGDAVIHVEHGLGALRGVEPVTAAEATADCLRLDYAGEESLLVPFDELPKLWRYGASAENVTLDRLDGAAWPKRRAEAEAAAAEEARRLLEALRARDAARAPALVGDAAAMRRFAAGFPFEPTPDQQAAIEATLADLARERPMDRLVCGDVGFGKTEVALRAAAAAALAGKQVALVAPTTVLVRQHLETFRRRFRALGIEVGALSRLTPPAEAKAVRARLADGSLAVAIGTTALAAKGVRFRDLGLLVIDEEQRFGAREKAALAKLRGEGLHLLTLTATPIPRTLQSAMIGLRDLSVIATPPIRRQPVRTLRAEAEDAAIAGALRREARRGGQSFVVCPRIEDIAPMAERLARLVPELSVVVAHGGQKPPEMDEAMVRFADGDGEVLLATGIVETGLDVPRANTMLVLGADRFGLAQLHQLRGRVGRGRMRGVFWAMTEPGRKLAPVTERRLRTLSAMDRLGAGFAISARDLDLRGAGELMGEQQAGHLRAIGIELHQALLRRALAAARGEPLPEEWTPAVVLGIDAFIPPDHVREDALRVELHARLGTLLRDADGPGLDALEEEAEDRFGTAPEPMANLFALARLALRCRALGVARLEAGPQAAAARFHGTPPAKLAPPLLLKDGRALLRRALPDAAARLAAAEALLDALEGRARAAA
jgi:transcription-repair coupling factor (superfamily II helicase)